MENRNNTLTNKATPLQSDVKLIEKDEDGDEQHDEVECPWCNAEIPRMVLLTCDSCKNIICEICEELNCNHGNHKCPICHGISSKCS